MTLVNRVSAFFLAALAIGLVTYSLASYLLIRGYLYDEFDRQLNSSLNVLVAAVEVEPDGVKWQPSDHTITLGDEGDADEIRWVLVDEHGTVIDQSRNLTSHSDSEQALLNLARSSTEPENTVFEFSNWRVLRKQLSCPTPKEPDERDIDEFAAVTVLAARSSRDLHTDLFQLALLTSVLPVVLWLVAAIVGRAYCKRALDPVRAMAARARSIEPADFQARLKPSSQRDELADLANAFNGLLDQLQQAFEQQRRFTGDAAHQLRTPLTVLRGQIDVALRRPRTEAEYQDVLVTLRNETVTLQQIVETLLYLARAENDAEALKAETISLRDWLPSHMRRWSEHPRSEDLSWEIDTDASVSVAPNLLGQVLDNLVDNALKYSPPGSPVRISATANGGEARITIDDQGAGIAREDREVIFEPFFRSQQARQSGVGGTGLGLSLAARIMKAYGGTITCEPGMPIGTRFTVCLQRVTVSTPTVVRGTLSQANV